MEKKTVAVIGSGISGLTACHLLGDEYNVTIYDREETLGMDSQSISLPGSTRRVDTPLRIFNPLHYPNLTSIYASLSINFAPVSSAFSLSALPSLLPMVSPKPTAAWFRYTNVNGFPVVTPPALSSPYIKNLYRAFQTAFYLCRFFFSCHFLPSPPPTQSLGEYIQDYPDFIKRQVILPMLSVVCTCSYDSCMRYPADIVTQYYSRQGLITWLPWNGLKHGGAHCRVTDGIDKVVERLAEKGRKRLGAGVESITLVKDVRKISVKAGGAEHLFDFVVVATQPNQAAALLPTECKAKRTLEKFEVEYSKVLVHKDRSLMPSKACDWTGVNIMVGDRKEGLEASQCSIWLNAIQDVEDGDVFQTWNPAQVPEKVLKEAVFSRPLLTVGSKQLCKELAEEQGNHGIFFVGSYVPYDMPLLENGVVSAIEVGRRLGLEIRCS